MLPRWEPEIPVSALSRQLSDRSSVHAAAALPRLPPPPLSGAQGRSQGALSGGYHSQRGRDLDWRKWLGLVTVAVKCLDYVVSGLSEVLIADNVTVKG